MTHTLPPCKTPRVFMRRQGIVWCCPECGQLWTLRWTWMAYSYKEWVKIPAARGDGEQNA